MPHDLVVVGAGISGLACARAATEAGLRTLVLDRSGKPGGRCATRRFDGRPVDYGPTFLHGGSPAFLAALDAVDARRIEGWPVRVRGTGSPCQPDAFAPGERRVAFRDGLDAFPASLAAGLDIRGGAAVVGLEAGAGRLRVRLADGSALPAPAIALALPLERTRALLEPLADVPGLADVTSELRGAAQILGMVSTQPSLTVVAAYPPDAPAPDWDAWYPEDSPVLQVLAHDSSKRAEPRPTVMVYQAHARWSRARLDAEPAAWSAEILAEAARLAGAWALSPSFVHAQRWRHARVDRGTELARPMLLALPGGARVGLAGEVFAPGGGAEAAFSSGRALGARLGGLTA